MFVGARVAYILGGKGRLGVLSHIDGEAATMILDNDTVIPVNLSRISLANYWKDRLNYIDEDKLRLLPNTTEALTIFKSKSAVNYGKAAMRAMWYWANANVFQGVMKPPEFRVIQSKKHFGLYQYKGAKRLSIISASATRVHSLYELFDTVLHEMIHQHNHEIEYLIHHTHDPQEGAHGKAFYDWVHKINSELGMKLAQKASDDDQTQFVNNDDEAKTANFFFAVVHLTTGWYGFIIDTRHNLNILAGQLESFLSGDNRIKDKRVYAGISNLVRVKREFKPVNNGKLSNRRDAFLLANTAIIKLLSKTATPIDGFRIPPDPGND